MKKTIKILLVGVSIAFLSGCAGNWFTYKQVNPKTVTVDEVVQQYHLPQVYVNHNGTRYVNVKTKEYAEIIVSQIQAEENALALEKSKIYFINNKLADVNFSKK